MRNLFRTVLLFCLTLSLVLPIGHSVNSQGIPFGIAPENPEIPYFEFTLNPGESAESAFIIKNFSSEKLFMVVDAVDGKAALNGGLSYDFPNTSGPSKWVNIQKETNFEIRPSNVIRFPFTVTIPPGTPPGEYAAGFLAGLVPVTPTPIPDSEKLETGYSIDVVTRVAIAIIIHVPGKEICSLEMKEFKATVFSGLWRYEILVTNTGNVHYKGKYKLTVWDQATDQVVAEAEKPIGYFATGSDMQSYTSFDIPEPGGYRYKIEFIDQNRPECTSAFEGETEYGQAEQNLLATQATVIAHYEQITAIPLTSPTPTPSVLTDVQTPGTISWYVWLSLVVLLLAAGMVIYALSVLKRSKK